MRSRDVRLHYSSHDKMQPGPAPLTLIHQQQGGGANMGELSGTTQYAGAAMFGFLAVGAVAVFSFLSVAHWLGLRTAERQSRDRFA